MDDARDTSLLTALTTEHFVLQGASSATVAEAGARSSLYVLSLSSTMVAMGFTVRSPEAFLPFAAAVLPALFLMGVVTVVRLVDTTLENLQHMAGIARIHSYYRGLAPDAAAWLPARHGRWPESGQEPSQRFGALVAGLGTTATMVAFVNSFVGGAGLALLAHALLDDRRVGVAVGCGAFAALLLMLAFVAYQRWRLDGLDVGDLSPGDADAGPPAATPHARPR